MISNRCSQVYCENNALKKCSVCKTHYCSEKCQKKSWPTHKHFCASMFIERLIKFVGNDLDCIGDWQLSYEYQHYTMSGTYEYLFDNPKGQPSWDYYRRCLFCHVQTTDKIQKEWSEKDYGDLILWTYNTCESCKDKDLCRACLLPHDESMLCPLVKRFGLLLVGQPRIKELPDVPFYMIWKQVRKDFIDYLLK